MTPPGSEVRVEVPRQAADLPHTKDKNDFGEIHQNSVAAVRQGSIDTSMYDCRGLLRCR